jgi:acyl carrier protein
VAPDRTTSRLEQEGRREMQVERTEVEATIRGFLQRVKKPTDFSDDTLLHGDGLNLDSLETAELSAVLEDAYETDPFSAESVPPETIGGILDYYSALASGG